LPQPHRHPTVLLVNDFDDASEGLEQLLRKHGYEVVRARDGAEALAKLRGGAAPCVILLDLMMPIMDGFAFRDEQLRDPELAHIPVVVFSGIADPQAHAGRLRANAYMQIPGEIGSLLAALEQHCLK
jgi:two-component system, OmpR family, response regulator CpxR